MPTLLNKFVEVAPLRRLTRNLGVFDYSVPAKLQPRIQIGQLVTVPFKNSNIQGVVSKIKSQPHKLKTKLKPVTNIINQAPIVNHYQIKLAFALASEYYVSPTLFFKLMVPEIRQRVLQANLPASSVGGRRVACKKAPKPTLIWYQQPPYRTFYQLINKALKQNKQVLILEPQLADLERLASQLRNLGVKNYLVVYGELSAQQRFTAWQQIYSGKAKIILGTKTALFYNYPNLGLIIINQEHSPDYKNYDQNPRYHTREVALKLCELTGAKLIFFSYAPSIETYHLAKKNNWQIIQPKIELAKPTIIDLKEEIKKQNFLPLSEKLQQEIELTIKQKKQVLLFLNRRGQGTLITCQDCGYQVICPQCQMPLTEHRVVLKLICHHCGYQQPNLVRCPKCNGTNLKASGLGTQKLEAIIKKIFPQDKVLRIDKDQPLAHLTNLNQADIIIASQSIFNLPLAKDLKLIAVVSFDQLLNVPVFNASERAWQLLWRLQSHFSVIKPELLIQTYNPDNSVLNKFLTGDWSGFYLQEITNREKYQLPPIIKIIKLFKTSDDSQTLKSEGEKIKKVFSQFQPQIQEQKKIKQKFLINIFLKILPEQKLDFTQLPTDWQIEVNPEKI